MGIVSGSSMFATSMSSTSNPETSGSSAATAVTTSGRQASGRSRWTSLQGLTYDGCPAEKDGVVFVAEAHIEPVTCAAPRYTRLAALDTISRLDQRRCRSRRAGELWRRLEKLLDGGEVKGR